MNGNLLPAEAGEFDPPKVRATPEHFRDGGSGSYTIAVGKVFAMRYGWPEQWIRILGKRIHKLHVKEYSRKRMNEHGLAAGFAVEYLDGDDDWPAVMKALDDIGYRGWATAEPAWHPQGVDSLTRLKQISEKMDQIFTL
jgi:hexulose-6-phosphate isomerase